MVTGVPSCIKQLHASERFFCFRNIRRVWFWAKSENIRSVEEIAGAESPAESGPEKKTNVVLAPSHMIFRKSPPTFIDSSNHGRPTCYKKSVAVLRFGTLAKEQIEDASVVFLATTSSTKLCLNLQFHGGLLEVGRLCQE